MRILLTGGAGFVGRNMIRHIRSFILNANITVIDNLVEDPSSFFVQHLDAQVDRFIRMDVSSPSFKEWATHQTFDLLIHCAAVVGGKLHQERSPMDIANNLAIDQAVLEAAYNGFCRSVIYFSSCAAYGACLQQGNSSPNYEDQLNLSKPWGLFYQPESMYGWAKVNGEYLCGLLPQKVTILRPFGGYGTDQRKTYPFRALLNRVCRQEDPLIVWGSGKQVRDWIHIKDVCRLAFEAHLSPKHPWHLTVNLGTGKPTSFFELAKMMKMLGGKFSDYKEPNICCDMTKPEGVPYRVADTLRMTSYDLHTDITLEEGIYMALRNEV